MTKKLLGCLLMECSGSLLTECSGSAHVLLRFCGRVVFSTKTLHHLNTSINIWYFKYDPGLRNSMIQCNTWHTFLMHLRLCNICRVMNLFRFSGTNSAQYCRYQNYSDSMKSLFYLLLQLLSKQLKS